MTEKVKQGNSADNVKDISEKIKMDKKNSKEKLTNPKIKTEMVEQENSADNVKDIFEKIKMEKKNSKEDLTIPKLKWKRRMLRKILQFQPKI